MEKYLERFVQPINYGERAIFWVEKQLLSFFEKLIFADCLPDSFWQGGQNCIQLVQSRVSPPFFWKIKNAI